MYYFPTGALQAEWDAFLEGLDRKLPLRNGPLSHTVTVTSLPADTVFTDARNGE